MRTGAFVLLVLLAALAAGCTAPGAPPPAPASAPSSSFLVEEADPLAALALARPDARPPGALDVAVELSDRWLKPFGSFDALATAPADARVAWFVELEETEPRATTVGGEVYVLKATTPDRNDRDGPRVPVSIEGLAPDGKARGLRLTTPGRYAFEADGARLTLNVWPDAPESAAQAFLVEEDGALRFEPAEIDVAPGARTTLWSRATRAVDLAEAAYAAYVPLAGREGRVTPIDEGLYRLGALAVADDGSRGFARVAFLVDFERPAERLYVGPIVGDFAAPGMGIDDTRRATFGADHPLRELVVRFDVGSTLPTPPSVEVSLLDATGLLARASSLAATELRLAELPAGEYTIEVRGEHGALVWYEVSAEGRYRLPTPDRLRDATT